MKHYDAIIIGGGSAGLSAAITLKEKGIENIVVLEKEDEVGGILLQCIHNGFGLHTFHEQLTGPTYAERFADKAHELQVEIKCGTMVTYLTKQLQVTYTNEKEGYVTIQGKTVLVATGCYERPPGAITIEGPRIAGIYTAGQAQKYLNMDGYLVGKKVAVLGSGDIGLIMARRMYLEGAEVVGVFEILPYSNGLARNIHQCLGDYSIPLYVSHTVTRVFGRKRLEKIEVMKVDQDRRPLPATEKYFDVDTLLLSVGLLPETSLLEQAGARLHPDTKGAIVDEYYQTSVPGLFASGNGLHVHDLVDYVTLQSRRAAEGMAACLKKEIPSVLHEVYAEGNVSYTIPCCIHEKPVKETEFFFRARQPMQKGVLHIYDEEKEIRQMRKQKWVPSEMERVLLTEEQLLSVKGNLHFSLREE